MMLDPSPNVINLAIPREEMLNLARPCKTNILTIKVYAIYKVFQIIILTCYTIDMQHLKIWNWTRTSKGWSWKYHFKEGVTVSWEINISYGLASLSDEKINRYGQ